MIHASLRRRIGVIAVSLIAGFGIVVGFQNCGKTGVESNMVTGQSDLSSSKLSLKNNQNNYCRVPVMNGKSVTSEYLLKENESVSLLSYNALTKSCVLAARKCMQGTSEGKGFLDGTDEMKYLDCPVGGSSVQMNNSPVCSVLIDNKQKLVPVGGSVLLFSKQKDINGKCQSQSRVCQSNSNSGTASLTGDSNYNVSSCTDEVKAASSSAASAPVNYPRAILSGDMGAGSVTYHVCGHNSANHSDDIVFIDSGVPFGGGDKVVACIQLDQAGDPACDKDEAFTEKNISNINGNYVWNVNFFAAPGVGFKDYRLNFKKVDAQGTRTPIGSISMKVRVQEPEYGHFYSGLACGHSSAGPNNFYVDCDNKYNLSGQYPAPLPLGPSLSGGDMGQRGSCTYQVSTETLNSK